MSGLSVLSWSLFALGYPRAGAGEERRGIDETRKELSHRNTLGYALLLRLHPVAAPPRPRRGPRIEPNSLIALAADQEIPTLPCGWQCRSRPDPGRDRGSLRLVSRSSEMG